MPNCFTFRKNFTIYHKPHFSNLNYQAIIIEMDGEQPLLEIQKLSSAYKFENHFVCSCGRISMRDDFSVAIDWLGMGETQIFPVTSAGVLVVTLDQLGKPAVILVNEEPGRWDLPSGHVEPSDETPEDTARREFAEETGLNLSGINFYPLTISLKGGPDATKAGLQYLAIAPQLPGLDIISSSSLDVFGRYYCRATGSEYGAYISLEPLETFLGEHSLLKLFSKNSWAYFETRYALVEKIRLAIASGEDYFE